MEGTSTGTITDFNGNFSINLPAGRKELVISYIGYKEQTVTVAGNGPVNVKMVSDTKALDEVVVIGYGVNEDNIKNKTERYSALIKGIEFLTNKGGVL